MEEIIAGCPLPITTSKYITMGHGSGGRLTGELVEKIFVPGFDNPWLAALEDSAILPVGGERIAFTTDGFVVRPLFFPGGDIGKLAVCGTINDLAVGGAVPSFLSAAFILEEGLALADLERIVGSMQGACREAGVALVTGDTKVVDRGKGDKVFITTSGVGVLPAGRSLSIRSAREGDVVLVSGTIGDHGIAILALREGIELETRLESDCASLQDLTRVMLEICPRIRCMRDPTRGGVSGALNEIARASSVGVEIRERDIPFRPEVRAACEMLGLDPLYVANEGKLVAVVPPEEADEVLKVMRAHPLGRNASAIGRVVSSHPGVVLARSALGGERVVMVLAGEQLPRIC